MKKYLQHPQALKLIDQVGDLFTDLPHLPPKIVDFLVKIVPFLAVIGGILSVLSTFSMLSIIFSFSPIFRYGRMGFGQDYLLLTIILAAVQIITAALLLMAYKPLKENKQLGWLYLYYSMVVSIVASLVSLSFSVSGVLSTLIWIMIDLYLLYEIRKSYK